MANQPAAVVKADAIAGIQNTHFQPRVDPTKPPRRLPTTEPNDAMADIAMKAMFLEGPGAKVEAIIPIPEGIIAAADIPCTALNT
jgi:hypothetical protein